jgi:2-dehydro-3-deoxyphosphogluconate aldolase/(4S)-4-hydroxy-2-oxoglutarate aldolase
MSPNPIEAILASRLLAIVRSSDEALALDRGRAFAREGAGAVEFSLTSRDAALEAIERLSAQLPELPVGAGTVLSLEDAEQACEAGASFLVAPNFDEGLLSWAHDAGVPYIPGVLTPSELGAALAAGSPLVKLFPAGSMGPGYVRELLGPFPAARLLPTGGIGPDNAASFIAAGAPAVAVGGSIVAGAADAAGIEGATRRLRAAIDRAPDKEVTK